jgi:hypothetical protein
MVAELQPLVDKEIATYCCLFATARPLGLMYIVGCTVPRGHVQ